MTLVPLAQCNCVILIVWQTNFMKKVQLLMALRILVLLFPLGRKVDDDAVLNFQQMRAYVGRQSQKDALMGRRRLAFVCLFAFWRTPHDYIQEVLHDVSAADAGKQERVGGLRPNLKRQTGILLFQQPERIFSGFDLICARGYSPRRA